MKIFITFVVTALALLPAAAILAADESLAGRYEGKFGGTTATLMLEAAGAEISGEIVLATGYSIGLRGRISDGKILGAASGHGGAAFFEALRSAEGVKVILEETGPVTGQTIQVRAEFHRSASASTLASARPPAPATDREGKLVGTWTTSRMITTGDMVLPVRTMLELRADGSFAQNDDPHTNSRSGQWRTLGNSLDFKPDGVTEWSSVGSYQLRGDDLVIVLPGSAPQVWTRQP